MAIVLVQFRRAILQAFHCTNLDCNICKFHIVHDVEDDYEMIVLMNLPNKDSYEYDKDDYDDDDNDADEDDDADYRAQPKFLSTLCKSGPSLGRALLKTWAKLA